MKRQQQFLGALLLHRREMLLMRVAQRSEKHDVGGDHPFQPGHFARLRDTRLDQREPFVALDHQQRQRRTQLRIVAARRAEQLHAVGRRLGDPLLDDRLAVRTGDPHHRTAETAAPVGGQPLQGVDRIADDDIPRPVALVERTFDQKRPHTAGIHPVDEIVRIVPRAAHCDEERRSRHTATPAVGHHFRHAPVLTGEGSPADTGYFA